MFTAVGCFNFIGEQIIDVVWKVAYVLLGKPIYDIVLSFNTEVMYCKEKC